MEERKKRDFTSEPEQFRAVIAAFLLAGVQFRRQVVHFELPLADDLVERLLLLLRGVRDRRRAVHLDLQILHLGRQSLLRLLQRENLLVQRLDRLLRLGQPRLQLPLRLLQFLRPRDALRLVLGAPQLGLCVRLAQLPLEIGLPLRLLLHLFPNVVQVVLQVAELAEQGRPLPRLLVRQSFRVLELGSDILIFDNWFTCDSASSNCLNRSLFSIDSFFFAASKSFNVRFTSSNLPWVSFNWCCNCFTIFSWAACFLFFEKENVYNTTPVARKFPSNSLFQQLFYCNYYIWNVQTRLYLQRKASSKEGEKEEEEEKHTRRGGTTSSAS